MNFARLAAAATVLFAAGCTTAGPFVTSISSDGRGNLVVEKSLVKLNSFTGTVSNVDPSSTTIKLFDPTMVKEASAPTPSESGFDRARDSE